MILVRLLVALLFLPARLFVAALGLLAVPVALFCYDRTKKWPRVLNTWHNLQDPVDRLPFWYTDNYAPAHWAAKHLPRFWWFAVRNPANNMRRWFKQPKTYKQRGWPGPMEPKFARKHGPLWRYRYSGLLGEFWYIRPWGEDRHFRFRIGWKIGQREPGIKDTLGYAIQLMPYRRG